MNPQYVLDTNILLALLRGGPLAAYLLATFPLQSTTYPPVISVVVEAELRSMALRLNWGASRLREMQALTGRLLIVPIPFRNIVEVYAQIDAATLRQGHTMQKNDLWIAATTHILGGHLLTTDRDFDALDPAFLGHTWIDPTSHL